MNQIIEKKLLEHLHHLNCPYCGASMEDVSIEIIDAPAKPLLFITGYTHCDKEEQFILNEAWQWLNDYPNKVFQELDRLRALNKGM